METYEVEMWNNWEYPSHWEHAATCSSYEKACESRDMLKNNGRSTRIIQIIEEDD